MRWHETELGFIRENSDGTVSILPHKYVAHDKFTFKATYNSKTGKCEKVEQCPQMAYILFDSGTREILSVHIGFNLNAELNNTHPFAVVPNGCAVDCVKISEVCSCCGSVIRDSDFIPSDFARKCNDISVNAYRWDSERKSFSKKTDEEIERELLEKTRAPI